ncbi:hypothetical protein NIIDMKKI_74370 [Mycobacterium kansasii]|uniref:Short chain dehydrogenase family protein n=1 Tax=Mycobacterium kansasii TaxID=1768 RepID=A0A7G1IMQ1_MYCKA|nr:hypothetical protein NIIDMKKI_74370 [Mycobacterium kansasii]
MGTYAITGAASGMGRAAAVRLRDHGHTVIGVDLKDADVVADLSTPQGRAQAADGVVAASGGRLDGAVLAAGLGPGRGAGPAATDRAGQLPGRGRVVARVAAGIGRRRTCEGGRYRKQLDDDGSSGSPANRASTAGE